MNNAPPLNKYEIHIKHQSLFSITHTNITFPQIKRAIVSDELFQQQNTNHLVALMQFVNFICRYFDKNNTNISD